MPRPKAKGKKAETPISSNEFDGNGVDAESVVLLNGKTANRGKKEATEDAPEKKVVSKGGRGKKKLEEVISKESETDVLVPPIEEVEDKVGKGRTLKSSKRGAAKTTAVEDVVENGNGAETELAQKSKGKQAKKTAKTNKPPKEDLEVIAESPEAETKALSSRPAPRGRKKKSDEKETLEVITEKVPESSEMVPQAEDQKTENEAPKKKGRVTTKKTAVKADDAVSEDGPLEKKPNKRGTKGKEPVKDIQVLNVVAKVEDEIVVENKPNKRGAKAKDTAKDIPELAAVAKVEDEIVVENKPNKRGAKEKEPVKHIPEVEKKITKRGRQAKTIKAEEKAVEALVEEVIPKKRSRKEPSAEKKIKSEIEQPKKGRGKRKLEKVEVDIDAEPKQESEENPKDSKKTVENPTTIRAGRKRAAPSTNQLKKPADENVDDKNDAETHDTIEDDEVDGSKPSKSKKKKEPSTAINATSTIYNKADFDLPPSQSSDDEPRFNLKISSWNVAGLRSWLKKEGLKFLEYEEPDIFCLQEIKCTIDQLPDEVARIPGYHPYWLCMPGGYAGVAIYSKVMPINVEYGIGNEEFDDVGRIITAEYEKFFLINVYVPNSGRKLVNLEARMKWEKLFQDFVQKLNDRKPIVLCGDMNVSHQEIDLANPKTNTRNAGFTKEERDKMSEFLSLGYVDTFRHLYPDRKGAYTFWTYMANARSRNVGWRLDYFIVSQRLVKRVVDNCIRSQCMGSDHCPITLFLKV